MAIDSSPSLAACVTLVRWGYPMFKYFWPCWSRRVRCPPPHTSKHSVPCYLLTAKCWVLICPRLKILGAIVNMVGNGGKVASLMHLPGGSANAALLLASAGLATAYAKQGIRVNAASPGPTLTERLDTGITNDARLANISKETALARMVERIPVGRIASHEEVANGNALDHAR